MPISEERLKQLAAHFNEILEKDADNKLPRQVLWESRDSQIVSETLDNDRASVYANILKNNLKPVTEKKEANINKPSTGLLASHSLINAPSNSGGNGLSSVDEKKYVKSNNVNSSQFDNMVSSWNSSQNFSSARMSSFSVRRDQYRLKVAQQQIPSPIKMIHGNPNEEDERETMPQGVTAVQSISQPGTSRVLICSWRLEELGLLTPEEWRVVKKAEEVPSQAFTR